MPHPYGGQHQALRRATQQLIDAGRGWCSEVVCLHPTRSIKPGEPWDLAHLTNDTGQKIGYRGPAHARCNRSEGATRGNQHRTTPMRSPQRHAQRPQSRPW